MYLKKRNKVYHLFLEDKNGNFKSKSTKCALKVDAMKFMRKFIQDLQTKTKVQEITYRDFTTIYKEYGQKRFTKSYQEFVHYAFDQFGKIVDGSFMLDEITTSDIHRFIQWKLTKSGERIVNGYLRTLQAAFQIAIEFGYLSDNVFSKVKKLKPKTNLPIFPSLNEMNLILEAENDEQLKLLYKFAFYTGMRMGEIRFLRWKSVQFKLNVISIENHAEFTTKNKQDRVIPLKGTLKEELLKLQPEGQDLEPYVFQFECSVMKKDYISRRFKRAVRACKDEKGKPTVNQKLHFHSLRHGYASHLAMKEVPLAGIRDLLGHQSITTTEIYSHLYPSYLSEAVDKLPEIK